MSAALPAAFLCVLALAASAGEIAPAERRSGYVQMSRATQATQDDDTANPGMLWVLDGETLWRQAAGAAAKACADCHGDAAGSMKGVAVRYPAIVPGMARPVDLEQRINLCRSGRQQAPALPYESHDLLALTAFVARQSRGLPIAVAEDAGTRPFIAAGRELFERRQGQLNVACSQCHDERWGRHLGRSPIPQAQPTGYPIYRLEWQGLASLQRRLRSCMASLRAEPYPYGAAELGDLELFLMWRARGMNWEAPAVRP